MRISLRGMLIGVALVALSVASLRYAYHNMWATIVATVAMIVFFVSMIVAVVDRGPRKALAIGCSLSMAAYYGIVVTNSSQEFHPWNGRLPTTWLLRYVHQAVDQGYYYDANTGKMIPNYDPTRTQPAGPGGAMVAVSYMEFPPYEMFMPIGHCWCGLLLGYAGARFALFVYSRRIREQNPLAAESS